MKNAQSSKCFNSKYNVEADQTHSDQTNIFDRSKSDSFEKQNWKQDDVKTLNTQITERDTTNDSKLTSDGSILALMQTFNDKQLELRVKTQKVLSSDKARVLVADFNDFKNLINFQKQKEQQLELELRSNKSLKEQIQKLENKN